MEQSEFSSENADLFSHLDEQRVVARVYLFADYIATFEMPTTLGHTTHEGWTCLGSLPFYSLHEPPYETNNQ